MNASVWAHQTAVYNRDMARGWESKSVEEQIEAARSAREARTEPLPTVEQQERESERRVLMLARARILSDLENTHDRRYRALLEASLSDLDAKLAVLG